MALNPRSGKLAGAAAKTPFYGAYGALAASLFRSRLEESLGPDPIECLEVR